MTGKPRSVCGPLRPERKCEVKTGYSISPAGYGVVGGQEVALRPRVDVQLGRLAQSRIRLLCVCRCYVGIPMNERSILGGRKRGTDHWATAAPQQSFGNRILPFRAAAAPPRRQQLRLKPPPDSGTVIFDEPDNFLSLREIQPWLMTFADTIEESGGRVLIISHHPEIINQWAPKSGFPQNPLHIFGVVASRPRSLAGGLQQPPATFREFIALGILLCRPSWILGSSLGIRFGSGGIGHSGRCLTIFFVRSSSDYYTLSGRMSSQNALVVFHAKEAFHFHFFVPLLLRAFLRSCRDLLDCGLAKFAPS